jgi:hypothetical protein
MNIQTFKEKISFINDTVAWDMAGNHDPRKCIDIDPFTIFAQKVVPDPLV